MDKIYFGDCLQGMKTISDNSVDAIVTDPPYGLSFMGKKWDYDVPSQEIWEECLRVLKPGGYLLAFAGTRTQHRMAVRIEDAGFEIRDMIAWIYGSGFPKSLNIGKAIDKINGIEIEQLPTLPMQEATEVGAISKNRRCAICLKAISSGNPCQCDRTYKAQNEWEGWGTALKPALEPITVARKPLSEKSVAENVLKWGTGGIDIDGSRVEAFDGTETARKKAEVKDTQTAFGKGYEMGGNGSPLGRFPANLIHDGSDEVVDLFPRAKGGAYPAVRGKSDIGAFGGGGTHKDKPNQARTMGNDGSAARFFYCAKASKSERNRGCEGLEEKLKPGTEFRPSYLERFEESGDKGSPRARFGKMTNNHPTVKPIALMEYLVKLVSKEGAVVLDPFAGSGSTGVACQNLKRQFIGCEMNEDYIPIIQARLGNPEIVKVGGDKKEEVKTEKAIKTKKGLSDCCQGEIIKGYCVMCCEKVV